MPKLPRRRPVASNEFRIMHIMSITGAALGAVALGCRCSELVSFCPRSRHSLIRKGFLTPCDTI